MDNEQKYIFHIDGMHCKACELMTESELKEFPYITKVKASLKSNQVEITGDFGDKNPEQIATELNVVLKKHGYRLLIPSTTLIARKQINYSDFKIAIPIALAFIILFIFLQKIGLVNLINGNNVTYGTAFVVGIVASLSSCMAVVGGLLLSMSATFAKDPEGKSTSYGARGRINPHIMFHMGRIVSFFILGGLIGMLGSAFTLNITGTFVLSFLIAIVMFILGINLLDIFPWAKKLQPAMPKFIGKHAHSISKLNHTLTPLLVGVATFFLPCGFTQSMQLYSLSTGSFLSGAFTMLAFALGTLPVLALISFSSFNIKKSAKAGIFFKTAGIIVILFAIFNLINSLVVIGILPPIFNF